MELGVVRGHLEEVPLEQLDGDLGGWGACQSVFGRFIINQTNEKNGSQPALTTLTSIKASGLPTQFLAPKEKGKKAYFAEIRPMRDWSESQRCPRVLLVTFWGAPDSREEEEEIWAEEDSVRVRIMRFSS